MLKILITCILKSHDISSGHENLLHFKNRIDFHYMTRFTRDYYLNITTMKTIK